MERRFEAITKTELSIEKDEKLESGFRTEIKSTPDMDFNGVLEKHLSHTSEDDQKLHSLSSTATKEELFKQITKIARKNPTAVEDVFSKPDEVIDPKFLSATSTYVDLNRIKKQYKDGGKVKQLGEGQEEEQVAQYEFTHAQAIAASLCYQYITPFPLKFITHNFGYKTREKTLTDNSDLLKKYDFQPGMGNNPIGTFIKDKDGSISIEYDITLLQMFNYETGFSYHTKIGLLQLEPSDLEPFHVIKEDDRFYIGISEDKTKALPEEFKKNLREVKYKDKKYTAIEIFPLVEAKVKTKYKVKDKTADKITYSSEVTYDIKSKCENIIYTGLDYNGVKNSFIAAQIEKDIEYSMSEDFAEVDIVAQADSVLESVIGNTSVIERKSSDRKESFAEEKNQEEISAAVKPIRARKKKSSNIFRRAARMIKNAIASSPNGKVATPKKRA